MVSHISVTLIKNVSLIFADANEVRESRLEICAITLKLIAFARIASSALGLSMRLLKLGNKFASELECDCS